MLDIIITQEAKFDLLEIGEYTKQKWGEAQRNQYLKLLFDRVHWLAENPTLGKNRSEIHEGDFSYHEGKHHIFYFFDDKSITIIGVLHEKMDFIQHF